MADIYVNADTGNDANTGTDPSTDAVKNISRALELVADPLTEETTIHLAGACDAQLDYGDDGDTEVDLENINIQGEGELTIQPGIWVEADYESGDGPFANASPSQSWDPTDTKPCKVPHIRIENTKRISIKGVEIEGNGDNGVYIGDNATQVEIHYCTISEGTYNVLAMGYSSAQVCNSYLTTSMIGIAAMHFSSVVLQGENYIEDCIKYGLFATNNSKFSIFAWEEKPLIFYTTKIYTTLSRRDYAAIKAKVNSTVFIGEESELVTNESSVGVQILNEFEFNASKYFGVILESQSLIAGAERITFAGKDSSGDQLNEGKDTVPDSYQFQGIGGSTIV